MPPGFSDPDNPSRSLAVPRQAVAYMYPELLPGDLAPKPEDTFVFQYWPESVSDSHPMEYATKTIPGGSHPLQQWTGGSERTISFEAQFTSEVSETDAVVKAGGVPSSRYTVNVAAARDRLESLRLPSYSSNQFTGRVKPPKRVFLVLPNTRLGHDRDEVLVYIKDVSYTYESWFPDGSPRIMTVSLSFAESVQHGSAQGSQIRFVGREVYERQPALLQAYNFNRGGRDGFGA